MILWFIFSQVFKPLWPSDPIWQHTLESVLAEVIACCLEVPSHDLNQCWLITNEVICHSDVSSFNGRYQTLKRICKIHSSELITSLRNGWVLQRCHTEEYGLQNKELIMVTRKGNFYKSCFWQRFNLNISTYMWWQNHYTILMLENDNFANIKYIFPWTGNSGQFDMNFCNKNHTQALTYCGIAL